MATPPQESEPSSTRRQSSRPFRRPPEQQEKKKAYLWVLVLGVLVVIIIFWVLMNPLDRSTSSDDGLSSIRQGFEDLLGTIKNFTVPSADTNQSNDNSASDVNEEYIRQVEEEVFPEIHQ